MATYACSDLHAMFEHYQMIKDYIKPEDKVYFLGDAGDRGPEPWKTIKTILNDSQFIYIKGNHEDMLVNALANYDDVDGFVADREAARLLHRNGGNQTFAEVIADPGWRGYLRRLRNLPVLKEYVNTQGQRVVLSHAGFTPWLDDDNKSYKIPKEKKLLWDRDHFFDWYDEYEIDDVIIIHGHTPTPYLDIEPDHGYTGGACWYDNGRKCCIDGGAVFTGDCILLNLDTWEQMIFKAKSYLRN